MYTRAEERESAEAYQGFLSAPGPGPAVARFLLGPLGGFLVNTPLFLLPRRLGITAEHRVLDIGCGRGAALRFLAARVHFKRPPVGIDVAPAILERAAGEMGERQTIALAAATATRLPFAGESFDLVLSSYVVKHLGEQALQRFLYECWRVLRPGGVLAVWEFAPTRSHLLNRFHNWLLTRQIRTCRLRGYGDFVDVAIESPFTNMELLDQRPFLFPPIPRTGFLLKKAERPPEAGGDETKGE